MEGNQNKLQIDLLFNCFIPQNSTKSSIEKCLNSHVCKTTEICNYLASRTRIHKVILVSSIYSQNYGYVSEEDGQINLRPLGYNPGEITSLTKLKETLSDIFSTNY